MFPLGYTRSGFREDSVTQSAASGCGVAVTMRRRNQRATTKRGNGLHRFGRSRGTTFAVCAVLLMAAIGAEASRWVKGAAPASPAPASVRSLGDEQVVLTPRSASLIQMPRGVPAAHASALAALPGDRMLAFWWAGERESGDDV